MATDDDLKLMAAKGTYLDPQAGLVIENYLLEGKSLRVTASIQPRAGAKRAASGSRRRRRHAGG